MTREEIEKEPWLGEQRSKVNALLHRAELAEKKLAAAERVVQAVEILSDTPTLPELWEILNRRVKNFRDSSAFDYATQPTAEERVIALSNALARMRDRAVHLIAHMPKLSDNGQADSDMRADLQREFAALARVP